MPGAEVDVSELVRLAEDLRGAGKQAARTGRGVVAKGALQIKSDWRRAWHGLSYAPALPYSISYDIRTRATEIEAEIGPDKSKPQGALGNLIEYGSVNNAPHPGGAQALAREEPKFIAAAEEFVGKVLDR